MLDRIEKKDLVSKRAIGPVSIAVFLGGIGGGIAFPILPLLGLQLGLSGLLIGTILSANRITRLAVNPIVGHWIDSVGGKRPLALGLLIEAVATGLFSLAVHTSIPGAILLFGRGLWGIGSSMLIVGGVTLALNLSSEETRGRSTAAVRMSMSLGMPAGLLAGGVIAGVWSDDAAFLTSSGLALFAAAVSWFFIPATGAAASGLKASARPRVAERLREEVRIVVTADRRVRTVWLTNLLVFFSIQGALLATLVLLIRHRGLVLFSLGVQPTAGVLMAAMILSSAGITILVGRILDRIASRVIISLPAITLAAAGFALIGVSRTLLPAVAGLVLIGIGMGGTSIPLLTLLGDLTPPEHRGHTVGIYQFFGDIGGSLGPIIGVEAAGVIGYQSVYLGVAVLLCFIVVLLIQLRAAERSGGSR